MPYLAALLAIVLYALGMYRLWPRDPARIASHRVSLVALIALACHAWASLALLTGSGWQLNLIFVVNAVIVVMLAMVTLASFRLPVHNLLLLIFPLGILALLAALLLPVGHPSDASLSPTLLIHILISLGAYAALMMAACQSILLAVQERALKSPHRTAITWLPPLETMEQLLVTMLWIGWILLTTAIATGFIFLEDMFAQHVSHHIVITSLSWLVYAVFLGGRYLFGWRGLTAVRWTLVAFGLLGLGYLGSKFVLEYLITP